MHAAPSNLRATVGLVRRACRARELGEVGVVLLTVAVVMGAWITVPIPPSIALVPVALAFVLRRPWLLVLAAPVLAGGLATQAVEGAPPAPAAPFHGVVTLVADPDEAFGAAKADVRAGGHRYELWVRGAGARVLRERLAGEQLEVDGEVEPRHEDDEWLLVRHVVGTIHADDVRVLDGTDPVSGLANGFRRLLERGAAVMDPDERALFGGFVLGDGRGERGETVDDFRASGLSHLLVVSGENVAFVLATIGPVLRRLGLRARFLAVVGALGFFAVLTRFEPSVMRAIAMTIIAAWGTTVGRAMTGLRTLSLAVAALVLIDPLLVRSVGFQLSAAASMGIIVLGRRLTEWLPGPRMVREPLAITLAAQAGVAPVLIPVFGGVPIASLPANVLALPAAGPVMVWGLTAGSVAGLVPTSLAAMLHAPTRLLLWWVDGVAGFFARVPVGEVRWPHLVAVWCGAIVLAVAHRCSPPRPRLRVAGMAVVILATVLAALPAAPPDRFEVALVTGAVAYCSPQGDVVLVVDGRAALAPVLRALRSSGIHSIDGVVARSVGRALDRDVDALVDRFEPRFVLVPAGSTVAGGSTPERGQVIEHGGLTVTVLDAGPHLAVEVRATAPDV